MNTATCALFFFGFIFSSAAFVIGPSKIGGLLALCGGVCVLASVVTYNQVSK